MALGAALVDRARTIRQEPIPGKVMGKTRHAAVHGDWFKVRLELPSAPESEDPSPWSRRRVVRQPTLMMGTRDVKGGPVLLTVEDRLEIRSKQLGDGEWEVISAPEPMRKKRRVIGWTTTLRRVETQVEQVA